MHANATLTIRSRKDLVALRLSGVSQAEVARWFRVSRATVSKWWRRYQADPDGAWFVDRSSRPHSCPHQTPVGVEAEIVAHRREHQLGPARIGYRLGVPASTVWKVLRRHGLNRLARMDRISGRVIRRYEKATPGELIHVDTKKLARIPDGGGWRADGSDGPGRRKQRLKNRVGYEHVHSAVDDHSRLAYVEVLPDIKAATCAGFWKRARNFYEAHGIEVSAVMTDNWSGYTSPVFTQALENIEHIRIRPYRPQTNGKVERFNRTLTDEWAYARIYTSGNDRTQALADWIHIYNHHRGHTAIGGPPITRVHNQGGSDT